jgi:hypothetical protein
MSRGVHPKLGPFRSSSLTLSLKRKKNTVYVHYRLVCHDVPQFRHYGVYRPVFRIVAFDSAQS